MYFKGQQLEYSMLICYQMPRQNLNSSFNLHFDSPKKSCIKTRLLWGGTERVYVGGTEFNELTSKHPHTDIHSICPIINICGFLLSALQRAQLVKACCKHTCLVFVWGTIALAICQSPDPWVHTAPGEFCNTIRIWLNLTVSELFFFVL